MKLSIFTTITNPMERGDMWEPAINCYQDLADEVVIVDGSNHFNMNVASIDQAKCRQILHKWPKEFDWPFIGQQFQRGYEACTGDWVIHCDLDYIFHEKDFGRIRQALEDYPNSPAISFYKWQFILPDRYNLKSRLLIAANKGKYGDRLSFSGGVDLCMPQLDGKDIDINEMPQAGVPFYNYEKITKTKEQIMDDQGRMDRAWNRHFGDYQLAKDGTNESAYEGWLHMEHGRFGKPQEKIPLSAHPKYVQETIKNLKPEQWGYNGFGLIEGKVYA